MSQGPCFSSSHVLEILGFVFLNSEFLGPERAAALGLRRIPPSPRLVFMRAFILASMDIVNEGGRISWSDKTFLGFYKLTNRRVHMCSGRVGG